MVVLCNSGRNPTNKGALAAGIEPGLVRRSERTLPAEPSPRWQISFLLKYLKKCIDVIYLQPLNF